MEKKKTAILLVFIVLALVITVLFTSCLPQTVETLDDKPAGFFMGIWHGWIAPISLIVKLFNPSVGIYQPYNTGWWYDFGFYMAIISGFGGLSLARRKSSHDSSRRTRHD
ncbi:hypothetical protein [Pleomorphochaeta sp. DL1XJH-081]|uniref:hypothetical protein n=1 Tax=Pleomorphochaeta sp. DL1XJH-081 TaxID=3409690 RepID=UPI003BB4B730